MVVRLGGVGDAVGVLILERGTSFFTGHRSMEMWWPSTFARIVFWDGILWSSEGLEWA